MTFHDRAPVSVPMIIDGKPVTPSRVIPVANPARPDEIVGETGRGAPQDVWRAGAAARAAQRVWGWKTFAERCALLKTALEAVETRAADLAPLYVRENGKVLAEARSELAAIRPRQKLQLDAAMRLDEERVLDTADGRTLVVPRPFGVVVSIVPWNSPISLAFGQVVAALATGNAVVVKPPETCPLTLSLLVAEMARHLPDGVLNLVSGLPDEIGAALITHPDVGKIAFTGSVASARRIMAGAASQIADLTLELGGNDAALVLEDAELSDATIERFARAAFTMAGQVCMAIKRVYVADALAEQFVARLAAHLDRYTIGDGTRANVTMGPMHSATARERAMALVAEAEALGARIRPCGRLIEEDVRAGGHFLRPTLVTEIPHQARLVVEEQFAPLLPVMTFATPDEAVERANATAFGLGGSVWSADLENAVRLARRLEAGTVFVNRHGTGAIDRRAPYGGIKNSGIGRKSGPEGLLEFVELQTLTVGPA